MLIRTIAAKVFALSLTALAFMAAVRAEAAEPVKATISLYPVKAELGLLSQGDNIASFASKNPAGDPYGHDSVKLYGKNGSYTLEYDAAGRASKLHARDGNRISLKWLSSTRADLTFEYYDGFTYQRQIVRNAAIPASVLTKPRAANISPKPNNVVPFIAADVTLKQCSVYPKAAQVLDSHVVYKLGSNVAFTRQMEAVSSTRLMHTEELSNKIDIARDRVKSMERLTDAIDGACSVAKQLRSRVCKAGDTKAGEFCVAITGGAATIGCSLQKAANKYYVELDRTRLKDYTEGARTVTFYVYYRTPDGKRVPAVYGPITVPATTSIVKQTVNLPCWTLAEGQITVPGRHTTPSCTSRVTLNAKFQASIPPAGTTFQPSLRIDSTETDSACDSIGGKHKWTAGATATASRFSYDRTYACDNNVEGFSRWIMSAQRSGDSFTGTFRRFYDCAHGTTQRSYSYRGALMTIK